MNLVNGFGARGYSARGVHLLIVHLTPNDMGGFGLVIFTHGSLFAVAFIDISTLLLTRGRIKLVKNDIKPFYFCLYGRIDMKYEISVSELTPPPNFSLILLEIEKLVKVGL